MTVATMEACPACGSPLETRPDGRRRGGLSSFCRCCAVTELAARFWGQVRRGPECWLWVGAVNRETGYGTIQCRPLFGNVPQGAHRLSWLLENGPVPDGLSVLHRCDVRTCVRPDHLFLGTQLDNMRDMFAKRRRPPVRGDGHGARLKPWTRPRGESHPRARLTDSQVEEVRRRCRGGERQCDVARSLGVPSSHVSNIVSGKARKPIAPKEQT
jgi:hypothetical protein